MVSLNLVMGRARRHVEDIIRSQIADVKQRGLLNPNVDPRAKFHLDTTKIAFHQERVAAWMRGERVAPITIDMALTQKCSYACTFCYAGLQQYPSAPVPWEAYENFLDDCVAIGHKPGEGVKAISLVSDGESTENPDYYRFIRKGKANGIDMASGTNGLKFVKEEMSSLVDFLTYLRINFNAAEPAAYAEIMGTPEPNYYKVIENIKELVRLKKERRSNVTIGLQMVLMPEYADQVIPLALLGKELGVDYTVIKHCSDDEEGRLGVDYAWYNSELAVELLKAAEALSTPEYSVQAKWSKIRTGRQRKYSKCFGTPLLLQMSGTGIVAPCGSFFHERYKRYHIGDIKEKRFKDIWASEEYQEVMSFLASEKFDARRMCETLCLQDKVNEALNELREHNIPLPDVTGKPLPMHLNFI
ncbi:MAG TPA: radical SAM protein [Gemmataceae bacterium]|nr:radical SAM protein [Gemmataceae bacterium]